MNKILIIGLGNTLLQDDGAGIYVAREVEKLIGDRDDVDSQVDHLLRKADQALTEAAQTASTDSAEVHTALLAEVDQAIHQAGEMVEEANAVDLVVQTPTADLTISLHTNQPHADSQRQSMTI